MFKTNQDLVLYADTFGIPRSISKQVVKLFITWKECSGVEWTVSRLKSIKTDFIRIYGGQKSEHSWIKFRKGRNSFYGPLGGLQKWGMLSDKRFNKVISLLQIYTTELSPKLTPSQEQKFLSGVNSENYPIPESILTGVVEAAKRLDIKLNCLDPKPLALYPTSPSKRCPHPSGKTLPEDKFILESAAYLSSTRIGWDLRSKFSNIFDYVMEGLEFNDPRDADLVDYPNSVGRIGLIQEPGYKLRAVANPGRVFQCALGPLGDSIYKLLKVLPWDCTHDQLKPVPFLQYRLRKELPIYSVDLSGATDYFPLDLQIHLLNNICNRSDYVELFKFLSRSPWQYQKSYIRWNRGQPLGLYPSFGSFALTHGLLLYHLNNYSYDYEFFVLGDDVVILDPCLHSKYLKCLKELHCPISEHKSLQSDKLCEFGGKIITPFRVISQLKWRMVSDDSFLDIVRNIGMRAMRILRPRQRKVAKQLLYIPDFIGGLGFNPKGISLIDRIYQGYILFDKPDSTSYCMSYHRKINQRNYYPSNIFPTPARFQIADADFDQKSVAHVLRFLPTFIKWYEILGQNLYSIHPNLYDLMIDSDSNNRISTLLRLERLLKV